MSWCEGEAGFDLFVWISQLWNVCDWRTVETKVITPMVEVMSLTWLTSYDRYMDLSMGEIYLNYFSSTCCHFYTLIPKLDHWFTRHKFEMLFSAFYNIIMQCVLKMELEAKHYKSYAQFYHLHFIWLSAIWARNSYKNRNFYQNLTPFPKHWCMYVRRKFLLIMGRKKRFF